MEQPTRTEQCGIKALIKLTKKNRKQLTPYIEHFYDADSEFYSGDSCDITYNFNIAYFGKVEESLKLWVKLMTDFPEVIQEIKLSELKHKTIVIQEFINKLESFKK